MANYKVTNVKNIKEKEFEQEVTLEKMPDFIMRFFGAGKKTLKFHGSGTVWPSIPNGSSPKHSYERFHF